MEALESSVRPRRVVYDVATQHNPRRRNKKKKKMTPPLPQQPRERDEYTQPVPLELTPLIQAALEYGRKTHALGALKAASALTNIVRRLRSMGLQDPLIVELIKEAETESQQIAKMFATAYEEEQSTPA